MSPIGGERYRNGIGAGASPGPETPGAIPNEAALVQQFRERLRLFALRRLRDGAAAEDVAQETLRRVLEAYRAGRIQNPTALPAFVFQTAQNICLQHFRSAKREGRALQRLHGDAPPDVEIHPLASLISEERRASVREALAGLSAADRELLRMLYYEGQASGAVAQRLGVSLGALRVRKHRVLARLAEILKGRQT
jgi:RNA polymerase sigma-70 factor, ECF subfamily